MTRFVIDAPALLHLVAEGAQVSPSQYLALTRLQADVFVTVDQAARARAEGIVRVGSIDQLTTV